MFKKDEQKGNISPLVTGVAGIVAGAAAATILANEENRKKVTKQIDALKKKAAKSLKEMGEDADRKMDEMTDQAKSKIDKTKDSVKRYLA